jgi:hypothetical protein
VEPGNDAEVSLLTQPGDVIKAKVDSIIWAQGRGRARYRQPADHGARRCRPTSFRELIIDPKYKDLPRRRRAATWPSTRAHARDHILRMVLIHHGRPTTSS